MILTIGLWNRAVSLQQTDWLPTDRLVDPI